MFSDSSCERIGNSIATIANSLIDNVINRDISDILVTIGWTQLGWISRRRNSGGVYFISKSPVAERFVALLQDLESMSQAAVSDLPPNRQREHHFIPQVMEVYAKPLSMNMWKGSAQDQYAAQTEQLVKDLQKMQGEDGDKMRDNTVQARADECDRLMALAEGHRLFLEGAVDTITTELTRVRDGFTKRLQDNADAAKAAFDEIDRVTPKRRRKPSKKAAQAAPKPVAPDLDTMSDDDLFNVG